MNPVLSFQNLGEIDMVAATTFGVNAKANSNPIGFFGTGLKYAIAIVLRLGGKVTIYSGEKRYTFGLQKTDVRGQEFDVVTMNRKPMGWTTRMGIKWEPWQAFRELYCNVKDEGGFCTNRKLKPEAGKTTIVVEGVEALVEAYEKRSAFFLEGTPIYRGSTVEVFPGKSNGIYYRGILVGQFEHNAELTYNITGHLDLTEDRTVKYPWQANNYISFNLAQCDNTEVLETTLIAPRDSFEQRGISYNNVGCDPSDTWTETVTTIRRGPQSGMLNESARYLHDKITLARGGDPEPVAEIFPHEQIMIDRAYTVVKAMQVIPNPHSYPLIVCNSLGQSVFGKAHRGKIFLSRRVFDWGQDTVTGTLFEELTHAALDMKDETRDYQNFLINTIARLGERVAGCRS